MANATPTLDATPKKGMDLRSLDKGGGSPFLGNVVPRNGEFAVREGFGLVRQYATTLNGGVLFQTGTFGLGACIGAFAFRTPFGHDQILAVHPVYAFTGDFRTDDQDTEWMAGARARTMAGIALHVHDLHSGRHFELVLHSQQAGTDDLEEVLPHGATRFNEDHSRWYVPAQEPAWAIFAPMLGRCVVLIDGCGLWTYRPVDGPRTPDRKLDSLERARLGPYIGETSALSPLELAEGVFAADGVQYVKQSLFPNPTAACLLGDRMVYASGSALFFSDAGRPDCIAAGNIQLLPTQESVTLLAAVRGNLFIATQTQCWLYQPSTGDALVTGGQLVNVAQSMGCVAQRAAVLADDGVVFADRSGIYAYAGGVSLKHLSEPIDRLWTDPQGLQLPWTNYYLTSGVTTLTDPQPPSRIGIREQTPEFRFAWDDVRKQLVASLDDVALVYTDGFGWSVWAWFSNAGGGSVVQARAHLAKPIVVLVRNDAYMVAGPYAVTYLDGDVDVEAPNSSCGLYLLGRGGALDASADAAREDERAPVGGWVKSSQAPAGAGPAFLLGEPIPVPAEFVSPGGTQMMRTYWLPVSICRDPSVGLVSTYELRFQFDNTRWTPRFVAAAPSAEIDFVVPGERIASVAGYAQGAPVAGVSEARIYLAGVANRAGNEVRIAWNGFAGAWATQPRMALGITGPDLVILLPFIYIGADSSLAIPGLGAPMQGNVNGPGTKADIYYWMAGRYPDQNTALESRRQPVDWAVKTANFQLGGDEFKVRGVFITAMHLGSAAIKVAPGWPFGPLNSATSSDYRDFAAQSIDFAQTPPGNSLQASIQQQQRIQAGTTGNVTPQVKVGNGVARWSSSTATANGNMLIDDAAVDTLGTSDGTQGTRCGVMLHGTMNAETESVRVGRVEVAVRPTGARRRWFNR